jgi:hypothetical protein
MRPAIAAASQLLLLLHLHCALCWTRQDFVDHLQVNGANETYFPPIPGLPFDNMNTAWTHHIHFAVPKITNKPQTRKPAKGAFAPYTSQPVLNLCVQVWLVQATMPLVTVDLGVDYGYSTFCFALPVIGEVCVRASEVQHQIGV